MNGKEVFIVHAHSLKESKLFYLSHTNIYRIYIYIYIYRERERESFGFKTAESTLLLISTYRANQHTTVSNLNLKIYNINPEKKITVSRDSESLKGEKKKNKQIR